jgi:superfamily I DNA/RNA helicase
MSTARQQRLVALARLLERLEKACAGMTAVQALSIIVNQTTLSSKVEKDDLDLLVSLAQPYGTDQKAFGTAMALQKDTDLYQPGVEKVSVMTLHAAKGLEFPVVFMAGCENDLIPYRRPGNKEVDMQEERRLFYVGMTRAGQRLFLNWARKRTLYGQTRTQQLSPFVLDIENELRTHQAAQGKPTRPKQEQLSMF